MRTFVASGDRVFPQTQLAMPDGAVECRHQRCSQRRLHLDHALARFLKLLNSFAQLMIGNEGLVSERQEGRGTCAEARKMLLNGCALVRLTSLTEHHWVVHRLHKDRAAK